MEESKAFKIIEALCQNGCKSYLTGGVVRDLFLGKEPNDYDVVTEATSDQVVNFFPNASTVGKAFEVCIVDGIEVAGYRKDVNFDIGHKNCDVTPAMSLEEDLARRDLTINAMAFCPYTNELIDPYGGRQDLEDGIIRFVGEPRKRIEEDPCRILRACRFYALLDGEFDPYTFISMKFNWSLYKQNIAPERIRTEIFKAMKIPKASKFFEALQYIGALQDILPPLADCYGFPGGKYHSETVFEHCMVVGDSVSTRCPITKLSGYLHDVGKPLFVRKDSSFKEHEDLELVELEDLRFSTDEIKKVEELIRLHMFSPAEAKGKGIRRFLGKLRNITYRDFLRLKFADYTGNMRRGSLSFSEKKKIINKFESEILREDGVTNGVNSLAINGHDIMSLFDLRPGPEVGAYLNYLYEIVLENPELNIRDSLMKILTERE